MGNRLLTVSAMLAVSFCADAGWFGYDSYDECVREVRQELMTRWISPLSKQDATRAAKDGCREYREEERAQKQAQSQESRKRECAKRVRAEKEYRLWRTSAAGAASADESEINPVTGLPYWARGFGSIDCGGGNDQ